ncbi:MAG: oxidoreductase [Colwellia sp.]|nr:oxidoreductase [Colwellia sp.]
MIKVGIIGHGLSAQTFHLPFICISNDFEFTAISTRDPKSITATAHDAKGAKPLIFTTPEALITSKKIDLVVITAPNDVHFSLAELCLQNNLHVIVEKPITVTQAEAEKLALLAEKKALLLSVFHNRRWDGDFLTVKKLLNNKMLGDIKVLESHFDRFRPVVGQKWKENKGAGTGVWHDLGAHLVDQVIVLFGLPHSVTAKCLALRDNSEAIDYFNVQLHYDNFEVILSSSPFVAGDKKRFNIQGTKAQFVKHGVDPQEQQLKDGVNPDSIRFGRENESLYGTLFTESNNKTVVTESGNYGQYYTEIAQAINTKKPLPVSANDGVQVMKIIELALLSSQREQTIFL